LPIRKNLFAAPKPANLLPSDAINHINIEELKQSISLQKQLTSRNNTFQAMSIFKEHK
jgi:hypothetical protein